MMDTRGDFDLLFKKLARTQPKEPNGTPVTLSGSVTPSIGQKVHGEKIS